MAEAVLQKIAQIGCQQSIVHPSISINSKSDMIFFVVVVVFLHVTAVFIADERESPVDL